MKNKHRILLISPYFFPHIGGSQRYMEELYVHLIEQFPQYSVDVLTYNTDNAPEKEKHRGLTVYRIPCWEILPGQFTIPNPIALITILYKLAQNKYDFVHTHLRFFDATWWTWIYAKLIGATSIFTEHVASRAVHENPTVELIANVVDQTLAAWTLHHYDIITATNRATQQFLKRAYRLPQPIQLLYGGVDTAYFTPVSRAKRSIPGIQKKLNASDIVISFVGRLIWAKGATKLYKIFRKLLPKIGKNVYLVIAGSGPLAKTLHTQIKNDNLEHRVLFLGPLTPEKVRQTLQTTDIFVHPSHHNEGFPNVILEAGACGNYVIATDVAGVREVIIPKKTGILIPSGDDQTLERSIFWAISHKNQIKTMGGNLRKSLVTGFDWNQISTSYMQLLKNGQKHMNAALPSLLSHLRPSQ